MKSKILKTTLCVVLAAASTPLLHAGPPVLAIVANPPALKPLVTSTPSRVLITSGSSPAFGGNEYASQWPGVYYQASFEGMEVYFRVAHGHQALHIVVDALPAMVLTDPADAAYRVSGLEKHAHTITVFIASENGDRPDRFLGFAILPAETALTVDRPRRQIEFIGDSHTVGYGNTSAKRDCTNAEVASTTDDTQAFGAVTAAHFKADYQVNAISGRGIVRNYNGFPADHLPEAYPYVLFDKKQPAPVAAWHPQWIVIALGTNDFSTPLNPGETWKTRDELHADYEATYVRFLKGLRAQQPSAFLLLWATEMANGEIEAEEQRVVERMKALGDARIAFLPIEHLAFSGCNSHPSVADDKIISDKLIQFIDAQPAPWAGIPSRR